MGGKKHNGKRINLQEANALFCDVFAELVTCSTELSVYEFLGTPFVPAQSR